MKSPSIDRYYLTINKNVLLVQSYTGIDNLAFIIKACRLKPYPLQTRNKFDFCKWWVDEFGNSFKIIKNKRIKITYNDLSLDNIACTDLYYGLSLSKIMKMSKLIHVFSFKNDENRYNQIITFLGIDNYLRSYILSNGKCEQVSPLVLGLINLKNIFQNLDIKYFQKFKNYKNNFTTGEVIDGWLSSLPANAKFVSQLEEHHCDVYYFK